MSWTSAEEVRKKIERRWKRGEILRALIGLESPFPLRLSLSVPSPREMALEFGRAQEWISAQSNFRATGDSGGRLD